jgi:hydroxypyruvate isomerase
MKYSICLDSLGAGNDTAHFVEAMERVQASGFPAFEFWGWWNRDLAEIRRAKERLGLSTAAFCARHGDLVDAGLHDRFLEGLKESLDAAHTLDCPTLIVLSGNEIPGVDRARQHANLVAGLRRAAPLAEAAGITLVLEPLNTKVDHAGYYLASSAEGFAVVDEVGSPNVKLLYDIYHMQIMEGDLVRTIAANLSRIGHFHSAGNPGRNELTTGEIDYAHVFRAIETAGYAKFVGLEYFPSKDVDAGLREAQELIARSKR